MAFCSNRKEMKTISLEQFARGLGRLDIDTKETLKNISQEALKNIKARHGHYQTGWARLKDATVKRKKNGDTPLLETGDMRDSWEAVVVNEELAMTGSTDDKQEWHEFGTDNIPARPVARIEEKQSEEYIEKYMHEALNEALNRFL
jgi:hypothetical protein